MKTAITESGERIQAGPKAPKTAICPYCQGKLTLRRRQMMNKQNTYFWRHNDNRDRHCQGRSTPLNHGNIRPTS